MRNRSPGTIEPESNRPESSLTVWRRRPTFCQVTAVPGATTTAEGVTAVSVTTTLRAAAAAAGSGGGCGTWAAITG
jgi:hypothetical protein